VIGRRSRHIPLRVDKGLQNQCRRYLIHNFAVLLAVVAGLIKNLVRLSSSQAFIPKVNWQAGQFAELGGKRLSLG